MEHKKKVICFGEVLWDVVADNRLIGGAPLNVCYHLSKQDIASKIVSQVGNDADGIDLREGIRLLGINAELISTSKTYPTSKVLVHASKNGEVDYDIVENAAWDFIEFNEKTAKEVAASTCFVYGSLITRNSISKNTLLKYLEYSNWNVLDLNLRYPYFDKDIIHWLLSSGNTLKINEDELLTIGNWFFENSDPNKWAENIFKTFPNIKEIILTKGARGVSYYSRKEIIEIPGIKVNVMDTVGSGDSFLAAYLTGKLNNKPIYECLQDAVALSAFIAGSRGACPVYNIEEIKDPKIFIKDNN